MDSLRHPVGPLPASVYWRRRALVILGIIVALLLLRWIWPSGGNDAGPAAAPAATASAEASESPPPTDEESPEATPSPADASESPTDSDAVPCTDGDTMVEAEVETQSPTSGGDVVVVMNIVNTSDQPCVRQVGPADTAFAIESGGYRVWSSDDCAPGGSSESAMIPPNNAFVVEATWPTVITEPGCPSPQQLAQPGSYQLSAANGAVASQPVPFVLN